MERCIPHSIKSEENFHNSGTIDVYAQKFAEFYLHELQINDYKSTQSEIITVTTGENRLNRLHSEALTVLDDYGN